MTTLPTTPTREEGRKWFWSGDCLMENQPDNFCSDHVLHARKDGSLYVREGAREQIIEAVNSHSTLTTENTRLAERVRVLEGVVRELVETCDHAPPIDLMNRIGILCTRARSALSQKDGE